MWKSKFVKLKSHKIVKTKVNAVITKLCSLWKYTTVSIQWLLKTWWLKVELKYADTQHHPQVMRILDSLAGTWVIPGPGFWHLDWLAGDDLIPSTFIPVPPQCGRSVQWAAHFEAACTFNSSMQTGRKVCLIAEETLHASSAIKMSLLNFVCLL